MLLFHLCLMKKLNGTLIQENGTEQLVVIEFKV